MNNLKKLRLIFIYVLFATWALPNLVFAKVMDSREIEIRAKEETNIPHSILPVRAWIDGNTIYVSFLYVPDNANVTIVSFQGKDYQTQTYQSPQTVAIPITNSGTFEIEISYDSNLFVGNFELD